MRICIFILFILSFTSAAGQNLSPRQYIDIYKEMAVREMKRTGIPASITLAQGILETESGNSDLVLRSNNHFGIKCKSNWLGASVFHNDDETGECFRKYNTAEESFRDHSDFLKNNKRYAFLFSLDITDYRGWATGLKKAGYATNPRYPEILISSIEKYNLTQYTLQGLPVYEPLDGRKGEVETQQTITIRPAEVIPGTEREISVAPAFKISVNGSSAIRAIKGTSLLAIAIENDIALSKLLEYNDLTTDGFLQNDQLIFLEKKNKEGNKDIHLVQEGEDLHHISQANGIQMEYLKQYNNITEQNILTTGEQVLLRPGAVKISFKEENGNRKIHTILKGENLYAVSKKYQVSVDEIKEWNKLLSEDLRIGQKIIILSK
ncbi:MAG: glucosaminidase domain-containing protein [Ferruginibacter sp.]